MPSPRIGNTPLDLSIPCSGRCHGAKVYIKAEDKNHFGTFKDRRCAALLDHHRERRDVVFVQITSGNSGYSLGRLVEEEKERRKREDPDDKRVLAVVNLVPKGTSPAIIQKLSECSFVKEIDTTAGIISFDQMRKIAKELAHYEGEDRYIVGVENYRLPDGYQKIVREINEDGVKPTHIFCPVGEGELITELAAEAQLVWGREAPKIIGVTVPDNVLTKKGNFLRKLGKSVADKLVNGYSKFKELVMDYVRMGRVELTTVSEAQIAKEYSYLSSIGISAEPSAAAAFAGAQSYPLKPTDTVVIINTGKGIYDQKAVDKVWARRVQKWGRRILWGAACIVAAFGVKFGYDKVQEYRQEQERIARDLETERIINDSHEEREGIESAMRAGSGNMRGYSRDEAQASCSLLGKPKEVCNGYRDERDFTKLEIYFLGKVYSLSLDNWARQMKQELIDEWRSGKYRPDGHFYELYPEELPTKR